jgi:DNA-binding response OmpR family regulator
MSDLLFRIMTTDRLVITRWPAAFKKEGWETAVTQASDTSAQGTTSHAELILAEVCSSLCGTPEELEKFIKERHPVATVAFASPQSISNSQVIKFLGAGADDFIFSDTDERVLVAKLKAYLRRLGPAIDEPAAKTISACGLIKIDRARRRVELRLRHSKEPQILSLTQKELEILSLLVNNENQIVQREAMLEKLWGCDATEVYSNCINKHIETLRKKLGPLGKRIRTVYGSGYMFV